MTVLKNYFQLLVKDESFQKSSSVVSKKIETMLMSYNKISDALQRQIMSIRQVKMEKVCSKLPRLVRSTAQEVRKKVQLDLQGMDIGVDKNIAQDLSQALTHMIRNSIDHGIEAPEHRVSIGKPAEGQITLKCTEKDGVMKFVLSDDGGGLKKDLILKKAIEKNLVSESVVSQLTDHDIFQFIFHPGFSTASQITSVSGRGVGMDVVNSMVVANHGKITVESELGKGTNVIIEIPVPKSVLVEQAVLVKDLDQHFVVPLTEVISVDVIGQMNVTEISEKKYLNYRGESIPLVRYIELANGTKTEFADPKRMIVVAAVKNRKVALTVDAIEGQFEAVIMPFDQMTKSVPGFKGTALIGEGSIAYVMSTEKILEMIDYSQNELEMSA